MFTSGKNFKSWLIVVCFVLLIAGANAQSPDKVTLGAAEITEKYGPAVVLVLGLDASKQSSVLGTGFMVTTSGVLVTNYHVIQGVYPAQVRLASGDVYDAISVIDTDERKDVAVLKIKGFNLPVVQLADSDSVKVGSEVVVIGNPKGLEGTVTNGLVSAIRDTGEGYKVFQMSAPISPGSSGSPVFDKTGQVIGIATATVKDGQNLNFAVPMNYVRGMISDNEKMSLEEFSKSAKPALIDASAGRVKLDAEEWGKRMANVIRKTFEACDLLSFGCWQTIEPHRKKYHPERFAISADFYVGREKLISAHDELALLNPAVSELEQTDLKLSKALSKWLEAADLELLLLKGVAEKGWQEYNASHGQVAALQTAAREALGGFESIVQSYDKHCPSQKGALPLQLTAGKPESVRVRLGVSTWLSRDDVVVMFLEPNSAAEKAGLKPGDCILGIENGLRFKTWVDWWKFMESKKPGDEVRFEVLREGKRKVLKAKLAATEE